MAQQLFAAQFVLPAPGASPFRLPTRPETVEISVVAYDRVQAARAARRQAQLDRRLIGARLEAVRLKAHSC